MKCVKMTKLFCLLLMLSFFLHGCKSPLVAYRFPGAQPNTVWVTQDGTVSFCVGNSEADPIYGSIETLDSFVEIEISMSSLVAIVEFYYVEDIRSSDSGLKKSFALGEGKVISKNEYQVKITSADAIFESGQILIFLKTDQ